MFAGELGSLGITAFMTFSKFISNAANVCGVLGFALAVWTYRSHEPRIESLEKTTVIAGDGGSVNLSGSQDISAQAGNVTLQGGSGGSAGAGTVPSSTQTNRSVVNPK